MTPHMLQAWRPESPANERSDPNEAAPVPDNAMLVTADADRCDLHSFGRAARRGRLEKRLFKADPTKNGEAWYDRLPVITGLGIQWRNGRKWCERRCSQPTETRIKGCRPGFLRIEMTLRQPNGNAPTRVCLPADVAVANAGEEWPENGILLGAGAMLAPEELVDFLADACHTPKEPAAETDSRRRQREEFVDRHFAFACRLLLDADEAAKRTMEHLAQRHLAHEAREIAPGKTITITLRPGAPAAAVVNAST